VSNLRDELVARLRERLPSVARHLYPGGKKAGASWRVGSLDVNLRTGWWGDWDGSTPSMSRNLVDLWIYATGVPYKTALADITSWLGLPESEIEPVRFSRPADIEPKRKLVLPTLARPNKSELQQLSILRSIPIEALAIVVGLGFCGRTPIRLNTSELGLSLILHAKARSVGARMAFHGNLSAAKRAKPCTDHGRTGQSAYQRLLHIRLSD